MSIPKFIPLIVISNGRNGSNWLATALSNCSDTVAVDFEAKVEDYATHKVHRPISASTPVQDLESVWDDIARRNSIESGIVGTKITLDSSREPWSSTPLQRYKSLSAIRDGEESLRVVHLTRSICDQNQTMPGHTVDPNHISSKSSTLFDNMRQRQIARLEQSPGEAVTRAEHLCSVEKVALQVTNDMAISRIFGSMENYVRVRYETLEQDFTRVLHLLHLPTDIRLGDVTVTRKNPRSAPPGRCALGTAASVLRDVFVQDSSPPRPSEEHLALEDLGRGVEQLLAELDYRSQDPSRVGSAQLVHEVRSRTVAKVRLALGRS